MTVITIAQNTRVLMVIDIAKARHEVLIAVAGKKRRRCLTVLNKFADVTRLIAALKDYGHSVRAAFEATGHYHRALAYHLVTAGFEVKLVSSVVLARAREALHIRWDNNDPKDAQVILHMMEF
jgi:transposase